MLEIARDENTCRKDMTLSEKVALGKAIEALEGPRPTTGNSPASGEGDHLAAKVYNWRRHADDPHAYWMGSREAADLLGVSRQRLGQLGDRGLVPYVRHRDGVRLYRREQLLTIANARDARWR